MHHSHVVLIITDDAGFARDLLARWQMERIVPGFTVMSTELFTGAATGRFDVAIIGAVRQEGLSAVLKNMEMGTQPVISVVDTAAQLQSVKAEYPRLLAMHQHERLADSLVLLATECLKRIDLTSRVRQAEQSEAAGARHAALGRYMLENRHNFNNLLTSVLGNSELLLMDANTLPEVARDQIETIHTMALNIYEIMQRFSSIAVEMQVTEKPSHNETESVSQLAASASQAVSSGA